MGEPIQISLGRGSNKGRYGQDGVASFVNAYPEHSVEGGKVEWPIYAINGLSQFSMLTNGGAIRAALSIGDRLLVVSGTRLFSVSPDGQSFTDVGGIPGAGFVTMARNRKSPNPQVAIVSEGEWFIYENETLSQGSDADLPPPLCVIEMDGYFVFLITDGRWFISGIDDTSIDGLDFTSAQNNPDNNVMGAVRGRELVIFGERSMEFYVDNGGEDFPFTRVQTAALGCFAAGSVAKIIVQPQGGAATDTIIWAATDEKGGYCGVMALSGYSGSKISTPELDRLIRDEPTPDDIRSFAWTEDGHSFYCISGTSFTMCWDSASGEWHERKSGNLGRWRPSCHAQIGQTHVFGDYDDNVLYTSDPAVLTDAGDEIVWSITTPPVHMFPHRFRVNALHIDALTGVGVNSSIASDASPSVMLSYSDDGGATFGGERPLDLGADGQRYVRLCARALGRFDGNGVSFRISCSASVIKGVMQMSIDADKLRP